MVGVCVMAAAFAGGAASQWLLAGAPALGQDEAGEAGDAGVVDVRELRLVDGEGTVRGSLRVTEGGSGLVLCDSTGRARTIIGVKDDGLAVSLLDAESQLRGAIVVTEDTRAITFFDPDKAPRAFFGANNEDGPMMSLFDSAGTPRIAAGISTRDVTIPTISLHDAAGRVRLALGAHPMGPSVGLADGAGKTRAGLAVTAAGGPEIFLRDTDGEKIIWSAP